MEKIMEAQIENVDDIKKVKDKNRELEDRIKVLENENARLKKEAEASQGANSLMGLFKDVKPIIDNLKRLSKQIQSNKTEEFKEEFNQQVYHLSGTITNLSAGIKSVKEALSQLTYIAEKTKVLSFNASIESARAGVHGKGFAVVSGEIRKLSDQSRGAIENVNQIISNTAQLIQDITDTQDKFSYALNKLQEELIQFNEIVSSMDKGIGDLTNINQEIERKSRL